MNLKINLLLKFDGSEDELHDFIADIGQVIVEWGYGNNLDDDAKSLVVVNEFSSQTDEELDDWLERKSEEGAFFALPVEG